MYVRIKREREVSKMEVFIREREYQSLVVALNKEFGEVIPVEQVELVIDFVLSEIGVGTLEDEVEEDIQDVSANT